jgi:hypothetical protein
MIPRSRKRSRRIRATTASTPSADISLSKPNVNSSNQERHS